MIMRVPFRPLSPGQHRRYRSLHLAWRIAVLMAFCVTLVDAARAMPALCDAAAHAAARETGVPRDLLLAMTRVETGRAAQGTASAPWPWTLNIGGVGYWYPDADAALAAAVQAIAASPRNVDIGCFQINYGWHGDGFPSVAAMLSPNENARYAAAFLRDLHAEFGDWIVAVGVFHSRDPERAARYLDRFHAMRASLPRGLGMVAPRPLALTARPPLAGRAGPVAPHRFRPLLDLR